jgi:hypothetical protein
VSPPDALAGLREAILSPTRGAPKAQLNMTDRTPKPEREADDVLDALLVLPPQEFTAARNAAAKQLTADGRREAAAEIKSLPRPPVSVWLLNLLAREQASVVASFLDAADALRGAYASAGDIRAATGPEREAEARVVAAATELARARGTGMTETVSRGLRQTLSAAAADAGVAATLRDGRLLGEPDAPSIDRLLGSIPQAPAAKAKTKAKATEPKPKKTKSRDLEADRVALQERVAGAESEATAARVGARAAADAWAAAQEAWERAQKDAEGAQRRSDAAEKRLAELQRRLTELESTPPPL